MRPDPSFQDPFSRAAQMFFDRVIVRYLSGTVDRRYKQLLLIACDIVLIIACFALALVLRGDSIAMLMMPEIWIGLAAFAGVAIGTFAKLGLYRAITRYITGKSMPAIISGVALGACAMALCGQFLGGAPKLEVTLIHAILVLLAVAGIRFWARGIIRKPILRGCAPAIIYGAGNAGQQLVAALHLGVEYMPVAFVDDDTRLHGMTINGVRVHSTAELPNLTRRWNIKEVLLAMPSVNRVRRRRIVARLEKLEVGVKTIPGMGDLISGRASFTDLRPVTPEDLLGRDPVPAKPDLMQRNIAGKVVLVTGAGGTIGAELCRQIIAHGPTQLVMLDVSESALYDISTELSDASGGQDARLVPVLGSVQNPGRIRAILRRFKVQTIYHAAAYKHVVLVEENLIEGVHNNVFGTRILAQAATEAGVENFILVSTDKTVRPTNVMGASKRLAELICQAQAQTQKKTTFSMVRFGNVLGSSGSVIPRFRRQIEQGDIVTVTHPKVTRYFMTITEAAQLVIQAGAMARGGDVFVLDMGEPVRILDLAKSMIRQYGLTPYMLMQDGQSVPETGDIGIAITGLKKGEKLYEELLIGNNPAGTEHPRIMTASEISMVADDLNALLDTLLVACRNFDLVRVQKLLLQAPLGYQPLDHEIHDRMWHDAATPSSPPLRLVARQH
ncbi:polysaccharide biosynthesis protein [Roseinatronobacter sp. NSM]|uniref:polysaccharide biosynthesis protein n=1 Tax=Roseinatronobacter sp. NSM TaxID=3457785 RepID=UPI004036F286